MICPINDGVEHKIISRHISSKSMEVIVIVMMMMMMIIIIIIIIIIAVLITFPIETKLLSTDDNVICL